MLPHIQELPMETVKRCLQGLRERLRILRQESEHIPRQLGPRHPHLLVRQESVRARVSYVLMSLGWHTSPSLINMPIWVCPSPARVDTSHPGDIHRCQHLDRVENLRYLSGLLQSMCHLATQILKDICPTCRRELCMALGMLEQIRQRIGGKSC